MPSQYAIDTAVKILDIVDDYVVIHTVSQANKIKEQLAIFLDGESLSQADSKIDPNEAYALKLDAIKEQVKAGLQQVISGI